MKRILNLEHLRNAARQPGLGEPFVDDVLRHATNVTVFTYELEDGDLRDLALKWSLPALPSPPTTPAPKATLVPQPGDALAIVIQQLGYAKSGGCGCDAMQKQMNEWGWIECFSRKQEIVNYLVAQAASRGVVVDSATVLSLLKTALVERYRGGKISTIDNSGGRA